jgi:prepilin-type N-terminal cleavage/methylation domain-containing protein
MKIKRTHQGGFTLVELLIVIAIIGLLASITMVTLREARVKAEDAAKMNSIEQYAHALELYGLSNGNTYPVAMNDVKEPSTAAVAFDWISSKLALFTPFAHAATSNPLCVKTNAVVMVLVAGKELPSAISNDPTDPACIRTKSNGSTVLIYAPLKTVTYTNSSANKQVGKIIGKNDDDTVTALCQDIVYTDGVAGFPIKNSTGSGIDMCSGEQSADKILGVTEGYEGAAQQQQQGGNGGSCSDSNYTTQETCEVDHSYCSDPQYTDYTNCTNNTTSDNTGTCYDQSNNVQYGYTNYSDCTGASMNSGDYCSDPYGNYQYYYSQESCEQAGYDTGMGTCYDQNNSPVSYYDQTSCVNASYDTYGNYCADSSGNQVYGYYDQTACEQASTSSGDACYDQYGSQQYGYYDQTSCERAGYSSGGACYDQYGNQQSSYYNQSDCEQASYDSGYCSDGVSGDSWNCGNNGGYWYSNMQQYGYHWSDNFNYYGYHWGSTNTPLGYHWVGSSNTPLGYHWVGDHASYGYQWHSGQNSSLNYYWVGNAVQNQWSSIPAGVWTPN